MPSFSRSAQPSDRSRGVLSLRGERNPVNSREPYALLSELEPDETGLPAPIWTLFLTNRECPWRCVMCDLWKNTLPDSLEPGLIPIQMDDAFARLGAEATHEPRFLKLYNSGSFFDSRAIPAQDYPEIVRRARAFERLIVECHPSLIDARILPFLKLLRAQAASGAAPSTALEVAVGLETAHPEALQKLNKGMTVSDFQEACGFLREHGVAIRVFLLLHPPFIPPEERVFWLHRSVQTALDAGASVISLIPLRVSNGALEQLAADGFATEPSLEEIESIFQDVARHAGSRVFLDLWDLGRFSRCSQCFPARRARLELMNLEQRVSERCSCALCGTS